MNQLSTVFWIMIPPLSIGISIAFVHFALLWYGVKTINLHAISYIWLGGGALVRLSFLLITFKWAITGYSSLEILAFVAGILLVRGIVIHRVRLAPVTSQKKIFVKHAEGKPVNEH